MHEDTISLPKIMNGFLNDHIVDIVLWFEIDIFSHAIQYLIEKENGPRTINDLKLINAGKILENNRTLADSRLPVGELPGGLITMHVVVRIPVADKKNGNYVLFFGHACELRLCCMYHLAHALWCICCCCY